MPAGWPNRNALDNRLHHIRSALRLSVHSVRLIGAGVALTVIALLAGIVAHPPTELALLLGTPAQAAYLGPGIKGSTALADWETWSGQPTAYGVDYESGDSWHTIEGEDWLLGAWQSTGRQLILSVPMMPIPLGTNAQTAFGPEGHPAQTGSLRDCAAGVYDRHWRTLANNLIRHQLGTTKLRPGWEFNGSWYPWTADGQPQQYAGCFRRIVKVMRGLAGQRFQFIWNPSVGVLDFPAELAFPGRDYVDAIGVDVYDQSWAPHTYPIPWSASTADRANRRAAAWTGLSQGDHGLAYWADFARRTGLRLTIPEWGLSIRPDGHGGGDDPSFVDNIADFVNNPRNLVAFVCYFDADSKDGAQHRITGDHVAFPLAAQRLRQRLRP